MKVFYNYIADVITLKMANKPQLSFAQMWNLSFGFFGVQIAYALQSANISRIFATLGADPHQLSFFWVLPPLMGMIVQPLIGKWSDRTWCRLGRRKPYLLAGAVVAVIVMAFLPNAGSLHFSERLLLGLNGAMWFGLFSLIFLDTSINVAMQPFKMMVGDTVNEEQKTRAYSIQSLLCNAGSLVGYLFPIFFTWIGISNTAPKGVIPQSVIWSFYAGAAILILCVLYTFVKVKEFTPEEYAEYNGTTGETESGTSFVSLLVHAPKTFWTVGLVQFFCWAAFLFMWTYTNGAVAQNCWNTADVASEGYQAAGNWVGVLFASYLLIGAAWAATLALPFTLLTNSLKGSAHMGEYLGLFNCTICLPQIVAAASGGLLLKCLGGSQPAMLFAAGVLLVGGAVSVLAVNFKQSQ